MPSAGDLERYMYCAHNWFLAKQGVDPGGKGSRRGIEEHAKKGEALEVYRRQDLERRRALAWAFRSVLALGSILILTLEVLAFEATVQGIILLVTGLVLVSATMGLLIIAGVQESRAKNSNREAGERKAAVVDNDLVGQGRLMHDPEWDLNGTPDYVMETEEGLIPVEVKTGKTPTKPFDSHTMQVASYLRLLEATTGKPPKYGLLTYPQQIFQIQWDDGTKTRLRHLLDEIESAERTGKADRNHEHSGRCHGCARRSECTQALV